MSLYVLDTNILVGWLRGADYARHIDETYAVAEAPNIAFISVVTVGEMRSLAIKLGWGHPQTKRVDELLQQLTWLDINDPAILDAYAEIDAYSQCKHPERPVPCGMSSRNMGKNDLWIAATTAVLKATLVTTDRDFDHLDGVFLTVIRINPKMRLP